MQKLINGSMQNVSLSGERGTASLWLVVESRMLYVKQWESMPMCSV